MDTHTYRTRTYRARTYLPVQNHACRAPHTYDINRSFFYVYANVGNDMVIEPQALVETIRSVSDKSNLVICTNEIEPMFSV